MDKYRNLLHTLQCQEERKNSAGSGDDIAKTTEEAKVDTKIYLENKSLKCTPELERLSLLEYGTHRVTRREFAFNMAQIAGVVLLGELGMNSCKSPKTSEIGKKDSIIKSGEESDMQFPLFEVSGTPFEIGLGIGKRFAEDIKKGFEKRSKWWKELKEFAMADSSLYETFLSAAKKHTPSVIEELKGWAEGSGIPFEDLFILNLKAEYGALKDEADRKKQTPVAGCSTIVIKDNKRLILAHNEDGDAAYLEHMFLLRVSPKEGHSFFCASYPGILPGNAPWINDAGIIMTTNFIYSKEVKPGVGRYFLDRLSMEKGTLNEVLDVCKHPERAYSFHHVIVSTKERKAISLEVTPQKFAEKQIEGIYIHTNHLIDPELSSEAQDLQYVAKSSMTRWNVLSKWRASFNNPSPVTEESIMSVLSSHEGKPYSPCRHPEGEIQGATLLTALFNIDKPSFRIYKNQPCLNKYADYPFRF